MLWQLNVAVPQELGKNWKTLEHEDMAEREVRREERRVGVQEWEGEGDTDDSNKSVQQSLLCIYSLGYPGSEVAALLSPSTLPGKLMLCICNRQGGLTPD